MNEPWVDDLIEIQRKKNNTFKRGELTKVFNELGEKYNEKPTKIKNYFYRVLKDKTPETLTNNDDTSSQQSYSFNIQYPHFKAWIDSYINDQDLSEWIDLSDLLATLTNKGPFEDFLDSQNLGNSKITYKDKNNNEIVLVLKEHLIKLMNNFNAVSSSTKTKSELLKLENLLKGDELTLQHATTEKIFYEIKIDEILEVVVEKILSYGAMVKVKDHPQITGLIHISSIKNGFVEDVHDYLTEGETIQAKVTEKRDNWRLSFSVIGLLNKKNAAPDKNESSGYTISTALNDKEIETLENFTKTIEEKQKNIKTEKAEPTSDVATITVKEMDVLENESREIERFIKSIVGPLSPSAKTKMIELIKSHGLFKFSIKISDVSKEFQSDLGLLLLEKVEDELRDGL